MGVEQKKSSVGEEGEVAAGAAGGDDGSGSVGKGAIAFPVVKNHGEADEGSTSVGGEPGVH